MTSPAKPVTGVQVIAVRADRHLRKPELLATEEPLEIRVGGPHDEPAPVAVTMRTPGHDFELAAGFLHTEAILPEGAGIVGVGYCQAVTEDERRNVVSVVCDTAFIPAARRQFVATSSCGICGKESIDQVRLSCTPPPPGPQVPASLIPLLPDRLREAQKVFAQTGGLHAMGLFDHDGRAVVVREDVGRHNALDKVVGHLLLSRTPVPEGAVLMVSGRVSFEIVQKAARAGIAVLAAVSAPSSLAVQGAEQLGLTVAGFVRGDRFNLYSHPERIDLTA
jgi:FdhD protein